ncbi:MAG: MFS transporter, partial [Rhodothermales bacterium]
TLLAEFINYRWPFLMFAITMGAAFFLIWRVVPQPDVRRDTRTLSVRRAAVDYSLMLRRSETGAAAVTYFLMFFSIGMYVVYLPTWLENSLGVSGKSIASLFLAGGLANVVMGPLAGRLSDRVGRKPLVISSCIGLAAVMIVTTYLATSMWVAYLLFAFAMAMVAMRMSPLQSLITALVEGKQRGTLLALTVAIGQVGIGISSAIAGPLYTKYGYVSNTLLGSVSILLMALLVWRRLPEPKDQKMEDERTVEIPVNPGVEPLG